MYEVASTGDYVVYIGKKETNKYSKLSKLTTGEKYMVFGISKNFGYFIKGDHGKVFAIAQYYFKTLQCVRDEKLKLLIG